MISAQKMTQQQYALMMEKMMPRYISDIDVYREEIDKRFNATPTQVAEYQWKTFLPDGLETENQFFWVINDATSDIKIGHLWLNFKPESKTTFIYEIYVDKNYRNQGLGTQILEFIEKTAKNVHGSQSVELHVFKHNPKAKQLYDRIGFETVEEDFSGFRMIKKF